MRTKVAKKLPPEINMIPMIDVIMMLLIFFLVATKMKTEADRIDLLLPASQEASLTALQERIKNGKPAPLTVNIVAAKEPGSLPFYCGGGEAMDRTGLATILREVAAKEREVNGEAATVRLRCDRTADFSLLQEAIKACQTAQIATVFVAAEKSQ